MKDKLWRNEDLRRWEEALPRFKECDLEKASTMYKAKTGVGRDGFHTKVPLDFTKQTRRRRWSRVSNGRNKPAQRCSS